MGTYQLLNIEGNDYDDEVCVYASLKMLMRHYLPKVVEKLRSTLVRRREADINQQTLALAMPLVYTIPKHTRSLTHTHSQIYLHIYWRTYTEYAVVGL